MTQGVRDLSGNGYQGAHDRASSLTHDAVTVGATSTLVASENEQRSYLLLVNDSDEAIYVKAGVPAAANEGIRINAAGGSLEISERNGNLDMRAFFAICATGSKTLLVTER